MTTSEQALREALEAEISHVLELLSDRSLHSSATSLASAWSAYKAALTAPQPVGEKALCKHCSQQMGGSYPPLGSKCTCEVPHPDAPAREGKWVTLEELPEGALFETQDGIRAVKSEYRYGNRPNHGIECVLLASGEYAHFADNADQHNLTLVREIDIPDCCTPAKGTLCTPSTTASHSGTSPTSSGASLTTDLTKGTPCDTSSASSSTTTQAASGTGTNTFSSDTGTSGTASGASVISDPHAGRRRGRTEWILMCLAASRSR